MTTQMLLMSLAILILSSHLIEKIAMLLKEKWW
jgi:hypothetical protein